MSPRLPSLKARDIQRILQSMGFYSIRKKGSHLMYKHNDGRFTLVPIHGGEDIGRGLLRKILREINCSPDEFLRYL